MNKGISLLISAALVLLPWLIVGGALMIVSR